MKPLSTLSRLAVCTLGILLFAVPFSTAGDVDPAELVKETQKSDQKAGEMTLVWWIPEEFWKVSLEQNANLSADQIEDFLEMLRPYVIVTVVKGKVGFSPSFESKEYATTNTKLLDEKGNKYSPLSDDEIDDKTKGLLGMLKPVLAGSLGPTGNNMHFLVFSAKGENGNQLIDAKRKGSFKVAVADKEFKWRLPLDSLLPAKECPQCKETCKGSWSFCPWCGTKLE